MIKTSYGCFSSSWEGEYLTMLKFLGNPEAEGDFSLSSQDNELKIQLEEYFSGKRKSFSVPLKPKGTAFQEKVWKELLKIPCGEVNTYGEIAKALGNSKGARAVGLACNKNPIIILIPCHRVVGKNGNLTGYACGLDMKKYLLSIENSQDNT